VAIVLVVGLVGGDDDPPPVAERPQTSPTRFVVGRGVRAALVLRPAAATASSPVVVFLHGWGGVEESNYGAWLRHLARGGATVVYPVYQQPPFIDVRTPLPNVRAALRTALARIGRHGPLVAAGHSAGGALAADLAASARAAGLPSPAAVLAVYPGRSLEGFPLRLDGPSLSRIPERTRVVALASRRDTVVGTRTARAIVAGATRVPASRRRLRIVRDPRIGDHLAPTRDGARERRAFWRPLDRLVRLARAQPSGSAPSQVPAEP
jgi:acetyl esterase/lipase